MRGSRPRARQRFQVFGKNTKINPMHSSSTHWTKGLQAFAAAKRCGANRKAGGACLSPAMENGRCRMHGGASPGAPLGNRNALKHGHTTASGLITRRLLRDTLRAASSVVAAVNRAATEVRRRRLSAAALLRDRTKDIHSGSDTTAQEPDA